MANTVPDSPSDNSKLLRSGHLTLNERTYRLGRSVGEGNHAKVYRIVRRPLVAKINGVDEDELAKREGEILESMQGSGVVRCFDHGSTPEGRTALILEYLPGVSFSELIGKIGPRRARKILQRIACTLEEVHSEGVIHRDVKPGNILILPNGVVKVLDFGLASRVGRYDEFFDRKASGTPKYMPPEQFVPGKSNVTFGLDIYALGVMITEALTGKLPFSTKNQNEMLFDKVSGQTAANAAELIATSPRTRAIKDRIDLADITARMLSVFPEDRPKIDEVNSALNQNP